MSLTILQARTILQAAARNAGISGTFNNDPYSATEADLAIQDSLNHFARETHSIQVTDSALLPSGTNEMSLSDLSGFEPERQIKIWPVPTDSTSTGQTRSLRVMDYDDIVTERTRCAVTTGVPTKIAFATSLTDAITLEDSDQQYRIYFKFWTLLTSYTAGTATTSTVLNISADMASQVLRTYGVVLLQRNQPQQQKEGIIANLRAEYEAYVRSKSGSGNMGVKVVKQSSLADFRARGW